MFDSSVFLSILLFQTLILQFRFLFKIDNSCARVYTIFITHVRFKEEIEMNRLPQISEAEFEVMKLVWN